MNKKSQVRVWMEDLVIPTYMPSPPDRNPMFLEKRVYQGSSGKVYPLPFTDRIAEKPVDRAWKAIWLESAFLRVLVLPEIGGRIHRIQDKTNGYDLIYHQHVIKPALVGLAGPWISGGIEFNWPQHHRPATFLPVDFHIEAGADGSKIIWCSDHDPLCRMKGMHGICLHPGRAYLELKVRVYNCTPFVQTFLWWANVATRVHEGYQSFFPPDVSYVADHARRSMSQYPLAKELYYGVNYGKRGRDGIPAQEMPRQFVPPQGPSKSRARRSSFDIPRYGANDLSWYANIPVPTSYMCVGSREDFFGGYDYKAQAGIVHIANHLIAPGKKQWTWGNQEFGYAWDRNLTDPDKDGICWPYIEVMAGVFTDNQPDFSFLRPGETKTWSQYWYSIQKIGPPQKANLDAAVNLSEVPPDVGGGPCRVRLAIAVTRSVSDARLTLSTADRRIATFKRDLAPGAPLVLRLALPKQARLMDLCLRVLDREGLEIISYKPKSRAQTEIPPPATEPPASRDIANADELFLTGLHLEQYRHATRCPTLYWREALRRDPGDSRCNNAMGLWHLRRGEFDVAEVFFRKAIERLTRRNANPYDGEPYYNLGLCLLHLNRDAEAYEAFYKSVWSQPWMASGYHALAEIDCRRRHWVTALEHADHSLRSNQDDLLARNLKAVILRELDRPKDAADLLLETLALDSLDWSARYLNGQRLDGDLQIALDIAHQCARAGRYLEGCRALASATETKTSRAALPKTGHEALPTQSLGAEPLVAYTMGWLFEKLGDTKSAGHYYRLGSTLPPHYCFPARLEEISVFQAAMRANPGDARAPYYLGNLFYDRRRHTEAIKLWERSARLDPNFPVVWRNLGIAYFNIQKKPLKAHAAYNHAFELDPDDARLLFERDQLWKRLGESPAKRLRELERHPGLVRRRDDLTLELCALYNQMGEPAKALAIASGRTFQPWEGGEGGPLGQWVRSHLALGRAALGRRDAAKAVEHFAAALTTPSNLGEARHLLANPSDVQFWLGTALNELGETKKAREHWFRAARFRGDFQSMSVHAYSEMTYYSAVSWERLGQRARSKKLLRDLLAYANKLQTSEVRIDYFATSLPTMLLFNDDLQWRQTTTALFLQAQARLGLGDVQQGRALLKTVLQRDPNHALAADFTFNGGIPKTL